MASCLTYIALPSVAFGANLVGPVIRQFSSSCGTIYISRLLEIVYPSPSSLLTIPLRKNLLTFDLQQLEGLRPTKCPFEATCLFFVPQCLFSRGRTRMQPSSTLPPRRQALVLRFASEASSESFSRYGRKEHQAMTRKASRSASAAPSTSQNRDPSPCFCNSGRVGTIQKSPSLKWTEKATSE